MKRRGYLIISVLFIQLLVLSCDETGSIDPDYYKFLIINDTGHKVTLEKYGINKEISSFSTYIDSFALFSERSFDDTLPNPFIVPVKLVYDDTISVWFNNLQKDSKYNIRSKYNYSIRTYGLFNETIVYTYTLTEADYQYALEHREENE